MNTENNLPAFDHNFLEHDRWFDKHSTVYQSEMLVIHHAVPKNKTGIQIGDGTGRFAGPFNIRSGAEPPGKMAKVAEQKGSSVYRAFAANLPIENVIFELAFTVKTVCFPSDIPKQFHKFTSF